MRDLRDVLAEHEFLQGLKPEHLALLTGCAANARFEAGDYLFKEGDQATQFFVLREGRVAIQLQHVTNGVTVIETLGAGEILGWSWLVPPHRWRFTARAMEATRAVVLDGNCMRTKCEADHELGYELLKRFSQIISSRLDHARLQLMDLYNTGEPVPRKK